MKRVALSAVAVAAFVAGCAEVPPQPAERPVPPAIERRAEPPRTAADPVAAAVETFRRRATASAASGDLASAGAAWHVLTLLAPDNPAFRTELAATRAAMTKGAAESLQTAHAALRGGDAERASAALLRTLALDPQNAEAARLLRELDRRKLARIQADRAAKVRGEDTTANARATRPAVPAENGTGYDLEQRIELFTAGDVEGGLRELKSWVDAHPDDRTSRQRIGGVVFDRGRELEGKGEREQALALFETAVTLRGSAAPAWPPRIQTLRKSLSNEYYDRGTRAERTDLAAAVRALETSVRYDPTNVKATARLAQARTALARLQAIEKEGAPR